MSQTQNEKDALLCVYGDCRELQPEDGEYCEEHFNRMTDCHINLI